MLTMEFVDASELWDLNKQKVEELKDGQLRTGEKTARIACIGMRHHMHFLDLQQMDHWLNNWNLNFLKY